MTNDQTLYRTLIDALVVQCNEGQGQVSARRIQAGVWNENADEPAGETLPEQHAMNLLLGALTPEQREVLAALFVEEFQSGVYNALLVLEAAKIAPFSDGTPTDNFLDRLDAWQWPVG